MTKSWSQMSDFKQRICITCDVHVSEECHIIIAISLTGQSDKGFFDVGGNHKTVLKLVALHTLRSCNAIGNTLVCFIMHPAFMHATFHLAEQFFLYFLHFTLTFSDTTADINLNLVFSICQDTFIKHN